ncbi:PorP/SprF family type IX secretion system membrane protein [Chitinophaga alhagiae]|uniref:PorP/SprF family type IX secretion system membrane protein n=1 Tax=Chitinophaga alhagiae TaxID=2203219 RepID=UPI000E5BC2F7|nr:type IX secretion system membrane protein PorP/SprF [Chitinophaga alhagiae]
MRFLICFFCLTGLCRTAIAQQDAQFSQYLFNGIYINPAYAGYRQELNLHAYYRRQWTGVTGAPETMSLALDGVTRNERVGLALQMAYDRVGAQNLFTAYGNYAYRIPVGETGRLAFGIGAGLVQVGLDAGRIDTEDPNDPILAAGRQSMRFFDARAGIYFSTEKFFAGFSVDNLTAQYQQKNKPLTSFLPVPRPHYFLTAGGMLPLGEAVWLKPSFLLKDDRGGPTSADLNLFLLLKELVWLGASYRTAVSLYNKPHLQKGLTRASDVTGMVEVFALPQLRVGYSYDHPLNGYRAYAGGSHEVSVGYYFRQEHAGGKQLRCFSF